MAALRRASPPRAGPGRGAAAWLAALALAVTLGGCTGSRQLIHRSAAAQQLPEAVELADTVFFPQEAYQCGPAALATVLSAAGVTASPEELVDQVYIPARRGSLQVEMLAAARRAGQLPYVIEPELDALLAELAGGRPVLVLQNLGFSFAPLWHYAVVIGYQADGRLLLRSGTVARQRMSVRRFLRTWRDGEQWGVVVLRPGELPARPDERAFLGAAAALEGAGAAGPARAAYQAAVARWPRSTAAHFALANADHGAGDLAAAEAGYRRLLATAPGDLPALNNLARLLLAQQRCREAREVIGRAAAAAGADAAPAVGAAVAESRAAILQECPAAPAGP